MSTEPVARPHPEPVVLNIGGNLGALVVYWDATQLDTPIEISPAGHDDDRQHQHVLERPLHGQTFYAAVFDQIHEGPHTLWVRGQPRARNVTIVAGQVTELHWEGTDTGSP
ncbi:hypothetical protein NBH00_22020 [Paraconexibacter antarcticus]|uniref:Phospholipase n=1 Tax=Paraconexibacter antarcticus TaxID=2949664 RepID=A0ABY5DSV4_9ACTN|nr:hypothetical protein [Paraconexibacter antarcticus]UTI64004.1 hypothetical protein NBH00_22020 [Paraconexibacter antarcticus]